MSLMVWTCEEEPVNTCTDNLQLAIYDSSRCNRRSLGHADQLENGLMKVLAV